MAAMQVSSSCFAQHRLRSAPCRQLFHSALGGLPVCRLHRLGLSTSTLRPSVTQASQSAEASTATDSLKSLTEALTAAVEQEDYDAAANLRDRIKQLQEADPVTQLQAALDAAIAAERYEEAASLRDEIRVVSPPAAEPVPSTSSDTVTKGVRVKTKSFFVPGQSWPDNRKFYFAYHIRITNESDVTVMLKNRYWHIVDADGTEDEVRGAGVVGSQPVLSPGQSFAYTSACPLATKEGTMEGHYEMVQLNAVGEWGDNFNAKVGRFRLDCTDSVQPSGA